MRFFEEVSPIRKIPTLTSFTEAIKEVETIIKANDSLLTCAFWWGSSVTKTVKITSDLDLVFLYPLKNTKSVNDLLKRINQVANERNIPIEVMCLPEEFYFRTTELDLSKLLMIREYEILNEDIYICGSVGSFTLENFGYENDELFLRSLLTKSYTEYIHHKYDRFMKVSSEWESLSKEERYFQAGKFISVSAHAMRKFAQAKGFSAIGFEKIVHLLPISNDIFTAYTNAEGLKNGYLRMLQQFLEENGHINEHTLDAFVELSMQTAARFILSAVSAEKN